jgi:hypothetical protein
MTTETPIDPRSTALGCDVASLALLVGIAVMGAMVFLAAVVRPAGLAAPPAGAIPLFVFTTTAAAISFVLLHQASPAGYAAAILTGLLPVATVVLVVTGSVGEISSGGIQLGPVVFTALGVALVVTTGIAWRKRTATETTASSSSPS